MDLIDMRQLGLKIKAKTVVICKKFGTDLLTLHLLPHQFIFKSIDLHSSNLCTGKNSATKCGKQETIYGVGVVSISCQASIDPCPSVRPGCRAQFSGLEANGEEDTFMH